MHEVTTTPIHLNRWAITSLLSIANYAIEPELMRLTSAAGRPISDEEMYRRISFQADQEGIFVAVDWPAELLGELTADGAPGLDLPWKAVTASASPDLRRLIVRSLPV